MQSLSEIEEQLAQRGLVLRPLALGEEAELYEIFRDVVDVGGQFPYTSSSREEFERHFLSSGTRVFVCKRGQRVIGGFYIKVNDGQVANAAYMIDGLERGQGLGRLLVTASLHLAQQLGFRAMQYNCVLPQNQVAVKLYKSLGFEVIGTTRSPEGYIMIRQLGDSDE